METILEHHRRQTPQPTPFSFLRRFPDYFIQYFDDTPARDPRKAECRGDFSPIEAERRQTRGCGVYFTPNAFVVARRLEYLERIQAVFLDVDCAKEGHGPGLTEIERRKTDSLLSLVGGRIPPHAITETKNGLQPIWRVRPLDVERGMRLFRQAMDALLRRFDGDLGAKDPTRVLRLPGFLHLKDPSDPFRCRLVWNELGREPEDIEGILREYHVPTERARSGWVPKPRVGPLDGLDVAEVIEAAAREAGTVVTFRRNGDGSLQILEDGEVTSGFVSARGNFCHSSSGKARRGGPVQLAQYYLGLDREQAWRWLAERFGYNRGAGRKRDQAGHGGRGSRI